ncbi:TPR-like protein [Pleomassaria siparia CBS 279.74]|uniref:TPR-like protein n=1 Tax=Pleomassaria siparia CBS 279.74 TaxID=1314801 RepID=A0A6G1KD36_9PLEO|nr:TPR-like protein [Pleomassaria siparia CBS 279.74]
MMRIGRGSIGDVQYTGDEAAAEIKTLLDAVVENEDDFEKWEALVLRASDLEGGVTRNSSPSAIELVRNVFDRFLAKFPLFFGYWKKYADLEFSIGGTETAEMVYERGVSCISSSVDLWTNYCSFKMDTCHDYDIIRELFERGSQFVGLDYQGHPFWDKYVEFEERVQEPSRVVKLHERIVHIPMYQFQRYYEKFRAFITSNTSKIEDLTAPETLEVLRKAIAVENQGLPEKSELELERLLRTKIDHFYWEVYNRTQTEVQARWTYEQVIKRAYFHVTEVEDAELANWRKYLDFEEAEGDFERTSFLYERCLVVCALYEEFWLRYARWMFAQGKEEDARLVYMRASCIFVPISRPTIRLHWARFEEKIGRIHVARDIHEAILFQVPDHVETIISLAGVERRHEGNDAAVQVLERYINKRDDNVGGVLAAEQARILWRCKGSADEARNLFKDKHDKYLDSRDFWIKYLSFEIEQPALNEQEAHARIKEVHDLLRTKGHFSSETKKELSHLYMEYLLDCGGKDVAAEYMKLDKEVNGYVSSAIDAPPLSPQSLSKRPPHFAEPSQKHYVA